MEYVNALKYDIDRMFKTSDMKIQDIKNIILATEKSVKKYLNQHPDEDISIIETKMNNLLNTDLYSLKHPTRSDLYLFKTLETILKEPNIIGDLLVSPKIDDIVNSCETRYKYTSSIAENYLTLLKDAFNANKNIITSETKKELLDHNLSSSEIKVLQSKICKFLKQFYDKYYNNTIQKGYINKMLTYCDILNFTGTLPDNNNRNSIRLMNSNLEFLGFNYDEESEDDLKKPVITDLMKPEFYKNFKIDELIALSAFYANKVAKTIETYNYCLYIIYKTDLFRKYKENPEYTFNLSDEQIQQILLQQKIFSNYTRLFIEEKANNCTSDMKITPDIVYEELNNAYIKQALRKYETYYNDEFSSRLPDLKHDILSDLGQCIVLQASTQFAYENKKHAIESLLLMLIDKDKERNWGVILDETYNKEFSQSKTNTFLIGVDMKEFNMPITFHCTEAFIRTFMNNYAKTDYIPVYKGIKDMVIETQANRPTFWGTPILMKLSKEQRKLLRESSEALNNDNPYYNFIQHIQWMSHPNRPPKHIKDEYRINKDGSLRKYYYSFEKKKVYREDKLPQLEK